MGKILSQEEVDSLLGGISEGKVETETDIPEEDQELEVYDFSSEKGPLHSRLPGLKIINERLVGFLRSSISSVTGSSVDVSISATESVKFGDFRRSLPLPTSFNIIKMEPLRGYALLILEGPLVFSFVDTLFGGKGVSHVKVEGRGFTTIETKIVEKIVQTIMKDLERAWGDVYEIRTDFVRSEMDPQFAAIVPSGDTVIATKFTLELESASGLVTVCIPYSTIEQVRDILKHDFQEHKPEVDRMWQESFIKKIREIHVHLSCTLGSASLSGKEVLALKVDDVIQLDQKISDPVVVKVEGIEKFSGYPGSFGNRRAVKIMGKVQ